MVDLQPAFGKTLPAGAKSAPAGRSRPPGGFWHRPEWMNLVADALIVLASVAIGYAAVKTIVRMPVFGLKELVVVTPLNRVTKAQLEYAAISSMQGNFFTVDLDLARKAFENLPWVRRAQLRRRWPGVVEVSLEEHEAVAYWRSVDSGDTRLVNTEGEMFDAASNASLPVFSGPPDAGKLMIEQQRHLDELLKPMGRHAVALTLSGRHAWQIKLDDGMVIELGRNEDKAQIDERLKTFVANWPLLRKKFEDRKIMVADLRYPSGFAVRVEGEQHKGVQ